MSQLAVSFSRSMRDNNFRGLAQKVYRECQRYRLFFQGVVEARSPGDRLLEKIQRANERGGVEPPVYPTVVNIGAALINIIHFDEENGLATLNLWERMVSLCARKSSQLTDMFCLYQAWESDLRTLCVTAMERPAPRMGSC
jgi:hypothetical protein